MGNLIWIGNTLLPRGFVFLAAGILMVILVGLYVYLTDERS